MIITDPNIYEETKKEKYFEQHLKSIDQFFENINTEKLDLIERYLFDFLKHSVKNYPNFFISTLSDAYKGKGGKNIIFKNRKIGELFALDKLLSKPQYELNLLGLLKIFNPKLNEWYIRTLPNKSKLDNLG
ncbi:hypothetical protein [Metamycoplasma equirhinis]|uniref:hypothetical protein n=1 Tax=Metamycoplasma equirhinis TaxID=92402 RepID=UPI003593079D